MHAEFAFEPRSEEKVVNRRADCEMVCPCSVPLKTVCLMVVPQKVDTQKSTADSYLYKLYKHAFFLFFSRVQYEGQIRPQTRYDDKVIAAMVFSYVGDLYPFFIRIINENIFGRINVFSSYDNKNRYETIYLAKVRAAKTCFRPLCPSAAAVQSREERLLSPL